MSFFKGRIQLPRAQERSVTPWSSFIPCCASLSPKRIQLLDDSDDEQFIDEQDSSGFGQQGYMPNNISIFKDQAPQKILSRNPFARATDEPQAESEEEPEAPKNPEATKMPEAANTPEATEMPEAPRNLEPEVSKESELNDYVLDNQVEQDIESTAGGSGELMEFKSSFTTRNYENEPDWTELNQESDEEHNEDTQKELKDDYNNERIPQIEKEVLHLLPLTELSQEIPPNMFLKRHAYEKSMYGEEPLTSGSRTSRQSSSTNRFSQISFSSNPPQSKEETSRQLDQKKESPTQVNEHRENSTQKLGQVTEPLVQLDKGSDPLSVSDKTSSSTTAHGLSSDQMDHLGEKLAFIKRNIKMEELSEEDEDNVIKSNTVINKENTVSYQYIPFHRRASSSLIEVATPFINRFMTHININDSILSELAESPISDEEDLFDLTKVFQFGKNFKNLSEELVDSGAQILSDVAKNLRKNNEDDDINENEWLHGYL